MQGLTVCIITMGLFLLSARAEAACIRRSDCVCRNQDSATAVDGHITAVDGITGTLHIDSVTGDMTQASVGGDISVEDFEDSNLQVGQRRIAFIHQDSWSLGPVVQPDGSVVCSKAPTAKLTVADAISLGMTSTTCDARFEAIMTQQGVAAVPCTGLCSGASVAAGWPALVVALRLRRRR